MKENENKKNIWRHIFTGVFAVSLFVAFTTEGLAINPQPLLPKIVKLDSSMMTFAADGSMFSLEANALYPIDPTMPIMGKMTVKLPADPLRSISTNLHRCDATFVDGETMQTTQEDGTIITSVRLVGQFNRYVPTDPCFSRGLTGIFTIVAENTGSISIQSPDGTAIASGMGKVVINNIDIREKNKKRNKDKGREE